MNATLSTKIAARNKLNKFVRDNAPALLDAARAFVGKKVVNATNTLSSVFQKGVSSFYERNGNYFRVSKYSIWFVFKVSESSSVGCVYDDTAIFVGEVEDGVLVNVNADFDPNKYPTDFSEAEILLAREKVKRAQALLDLAKRELFGFGEY